MATSPALVSVPESSSSALRALDLALAEIRIDLAGIERRLAACGRPQPAAPGVDAPSDPVIQPDPAPTVIEPPAPPVIQPDPAPTVIEPPAPPVFETAPETVVVEADAPATEVTQTRGWVARTLRRLGGAVATVVLLALACGLGLASVPRAFGLETVVVHGASMGKAAPLGSLVLMRRIDPHTVGVGDVVMVQSEPSSPAVLHRVTKVGMRDGQILVLTKGDANPKVDPNWWTLDAPVPVPVFTFPLVGYLIAGVSTPIGWSLVVLLPGALACLAVIRAIWAPPRPARVCPA